MVIALSPDTKRRLLDSPSTTPVELRALAEAGDRETAGALLLACLAESPGPRAPGSLADGVMARVNLAPPPTFDREPVARAMVGAAVVLWTVALIALHHAAPTMGEGAQVLLDASVSALHYGLRVFDLAEILLEPSWVRWASYAVARTLLLAAGAAVTVGALCYHLANSRSPRAV